MRQEDEFFQFSVCTERTNKALRASSIGVHPVSLLRLTVRLALFVLVCSRVGFAGPADVPLRAYRYDDTLAMESIGVVRFSPDGRALAFVRNRALNAVPPTHIAFGQLGRRGDIWLQDGSGRVPRNLTAGVSDGAAWWGPEWSSDGQKLAFFSSKGGSQTIWLWERSANRIRQISPDSVVDRADGFRWIDSDRILCLGPPEGEALHPGSIAVRAVERATEGWARAGRGELTASVLESGSFPSEHRRLFVVNIGTGRARTIAPTQEYPAGYSIPPSWLSPNRNAVAVVDPAVRTIPLPEAITLGLPASLILYRLDGTTVTLARALPKQVLTSTVTWAPNGDELAFFAYGDAPVNPGLVFGTTVGASMPGYSKESTENPAGLWRVSLSSGRVEHIDTGDLYWGPLRAPLPIWTATGELVLRASLRHESTLPGIRESSATTGPAEKWWVLARDGQRRLLAQDGKIKTPTLSSFDNGASLIGVWDGDVWLIDPATGSIKNLTGDLKAVVTQFHPIALNRGAPSHLLLSAQSMDVEDYVLDLSSGTIATIKRPARGSKSVAFAEASGAVAYDASDRHGTFLWRAEQKRGLETLVETNTFLRQVAISEARIIDFTSHNRQKLKAVLYLPFGYQPGRRYPLIVDVYPNRPVRTSEIADPYRTPDATRDAAGTLGYALLMPELPTTLPGPGTENYDSVAMLSAAVMPAVDEAIKTGLVDPDRMFIKGHSWGTWAVTGILAQSVRFNAAMIYASSELVSMESTACGPLMRSLPVRYLESPHAYVGVTNGQACTVHQKTDIPWWRDSSMATRYVPITNVDRIHTPLLIVHGDLDVVAMETSEVFFNALVSLRRRAQFVRYWGEGHVFEIPANVRDMWQRTFSWFDDFGDISRDADGSLIFEGERVKSRRGQEALTPSDFSRFGPFVSPPVRFANVP